MLINHRILVSYYFQDQLIPKLDLGNVLNAYKLFVL